MQTPAEQAQADADTALSQAVEQWLRAHGHIPAGRDVVAVDYAVPFTVRWLTSGGRTGRRTGCAIPPEAESLPALGDMMLRRSQQLRFSLSDAEALTEPVRRPSSRQRHTYLPDCAADHTVTERCWVSYAGPRRTPTVPSSLVIAHSRRGALPPGSLPGSSAEMDLGEVSAR